MPKDWTQWDSSFEPRILEGVLEVQASVADPRKSSVEILRIEGVEGLTTGFRVFWASLGIYVFGVGGPAACPGST